MGSRESRPTKGNPKLKGYTDADFASSDRRDM